jgi:hypothetical protein
MRLLRRQSFGNVEDEDSGWVEVILGISGNTENRLPKT